MKKVLVLLSMACVPSILFSIESPRYSAHILKVP